MWSGDHVACVELEEGGVWKASPRPPGCLRAAQGGPPPTPGEGAGEVYVPEKHLANVLMRGGRFGMMLAPHVLMTSLIL